MPGFLGEPNCQCVTEVEHERHLPPEFRSLLEERDALRRELVALMDQCDASSETFEVSDGALVLWRGGRPGGMRREGR